MSYVSYNRDEIAEILWAFGEDALAERIRSGDVPNQQIAFVRSEAVKYGWHPEQYEHLTGGGSISDVKAIALAGVEVLEGKARPLARKRRRPGSTVY